jgi:hypothetical protein
MFVKIRSVPGELGVEIERDFEFVIGKLIGNAKDIEPWLVVPWIPYCADVDACEFLTPMVEAVLRFVPACDSGISTSTPVVRSMPEMSLRQDYASGQFILHRLLQSVPVDGRRGL